jgi:hypothetical protein
MDYNKKVQLDNLIIELTDSLLSICTNVSEKLDVADINYYKFHLLISTFQDTLNESDKLADVLSTIIPGLSIELNRAKINAFQTMKDILKCITKDQSGVISYTNYKKFVIDFRKDLLYHNDIHFSAIERYIEIYNK